MVTGLVLSFDPVMGSSRIVLDLEDDSRTKVVAMASRRSGLGLDLQDQWP